MPFRTEDQRSVTGSMLRDIAVCERRAWHDVHTDPALKDAVASFVQLLWSEGVSHEREVLAEVVGAVDLRAEAPADRRRLTLEALTRPGAMHVLGGEVATGDLVGIPTCSRAWMAAGWAAT